MTLTDLEGYFKGIYFLERGANAPLELPVRLFPLSPTQEKERGLKAPS
jgi:hypothetical protein